MEISIKLYRVPATDTYSETERHLFNGAFNENNSTRILEEFYTSEYLIQTSNNAKIVQYSEYFNRGLK